MSLPRKNRLPLRFERDRISREGKTFYTQNLTIVIAPSVIPTSTTSPRFGILLSKKVAKRAVDRNFIRRRVSATLADLLPSFPVADYLVIPKHSILEIPHKALLFDLSSFILKSK